MTCRGERVSRATNRYPAVGNRVSEDAVEVDTGGDSLRADLLAKCAGLYADRVACFASDHPFRLLSVSGEYFELAPGAVRRGAGFDLPHP
jgi:L-2-hydroxyglutarate oxidase LhgO